MATAVYIRSLLPGGAERQALYLATELQKTKNVVFIVHTHSDLKRHLDYRQISNIKFLKGNNLLKSLSLYRILKEERISNLICFLPINNIIGGIVSLFLSLPVILCGIRSTKNKGLIRNFVMKTLCNTFNLKFISNSYRAKAHYLAEGFKEENLYVIHNGIQVNHTHNNSLIKDFVDERKAKILSVGRFVPEKDVNTLLQAISYLVTELNFKNFELVLVGYGKLKENIIETVIKMKIDAHIVIVDGSSADLDFYYRESDLYVQSSIHEGMPNAIMEAMTYKLPIVATNAGDTEYLVKNSINGYVVDCKDYKNLAIKIKSVLESKEDYEKFSNASFEIISTQFSLEALADKYSEFLI